MIYVLGSINIDLVIHADRMPKQGETLIGKRFAIHHGGKGSNQAVAAARSQAEVVMIGAVGNDDFGSQAITALQADKIETNHIKKIDQPTGIASIWIVENDNRIIIDQGANFGITKKDIDSALEHTTPHDLLVVQNEIDPAMVLYGLKQAKAKQMTTLFNPAPMGDFGQDIFTYVDILCLNEIEDERLQQQGHKLNHLILIKTLGAHGVEAKWSNQVYRLSALSVDAVDTTAAGDTFIGAFAAEYEKTRMMIKALGYANVAAAISVTRHGAQPSIPSCHDIKEWMANHI